MEERLQKFLANNGIASRRKAEEFILEGKVKVNGEIVRELGTKVDSEKDVVEFNNRKVKVNNEKVYILLNKPVGYVVTTKDPQERYTVMDLLKGLNKKVLPVGRLDMNTSGAILLSNDGDFINKITHPRNEIEKTYEVTIKSKITDEDIQMLRDGVEIPVESEWDKKNRQDKQNKQDKQNLLNKGKDELDVNNDEVLMYKTKPAKVRILKVDDEKKRTVVEVVIHEGKNREVRKMFDAINVKISSLRRTKIGNVCIDGLNRGKWRYLTKEEIEDFNRYEK